MEKLDDQKRQFETDIGELTLLGSCPVNCLYHMEFDPLNTSKILTDEAREDLAIFEKQVKSEIVTSLASAKVQESISYANAIKGDHKMAPPPEQTSSKSNETLFGDNRQATSEAENESFGFMDAILELKKFFTDYPSLLELGKQLKQAQGDERCLLSS
ncbi:hypothetical protein TNIN_142921 [Trichonephila inaurata madagascariensis]|uniref:Uncharacterized protein n=1 Tax=Trichonephila inaurata madagascariensis TaxID=2747483 RepID=A0A8X6YKQ9_9ARAC|nr:hypothetical protein TNIN_142921 [Trichonephila inaurata madagascariensis]